MSLSCEEVEANELIEGYVHDCLTDSEEQTFEKHYMSCGRCFGLLWLYLMIAEELAGLGDWEASPRVRRRPGLTS